MKKYILILLCLSAFGCSHNIFCLNPEDITNMYSSYVTEWQEKCKTSFDIAEKEVFKVDPTPQPVVDTNPDPAKCVCKGTGIIVQGDGHKSPCPYHAKTTNVKR